VEGSTVSVTPEEYANGGTAFQLQCVRQQIYVAMRAQETSVGGEHVVRGNLAVLMKQEQILMERLARENGAGSQGFYITQYSRGPFGGIR
jgi:hypothetical protein